MKIKFNATLNGGRTKPVFLANGEYRPHLKVKGGEYLGVKFVDSSPESVLPGESAIASAVLVYEPKVDYSALVFGADFEVFEGDKNVARGTVIGSNAAHCGL